MMAQPGGCYAHVKAHWPLCRSQYYGQVVTDHSATDPRIRNLWSAVIDEGVNALRLICPGEDNYRKKLAIRLEARRWFLSGRDGIGSFRWICTDVLAISPRVVLAGLVAQGLLNDGAVVIRHKRSYRKRHPV